MPQPDFVTTPTPTDVQWLSYFLWAANETSPAKMPCRVAATANVTISNPGTAVFDGVTLANGERLFLAFQTDAAQNGLWIFNGSGVALTRAPDADQDDELKIGCTVTINEGTRFAGSQWRLTTVSAGIANDVGVSNQVWKLLTWHSLGSQTIGTSQATVAHQLPYTPGEIRLQHTSDGRIWESGAATSTIILLTADAAGRTANVWVK